MLKKKDFDDAAVVAALRRGHRQRLYFEQIAVFRHKFMNYSGQRFILCAVENSTLDEQDCGLDFFDPTDRRYRYRMREERKNTAARHSPQSGCDLSSLDSHSSRPSIPRYRQPLRIRTNSQNLRNQKLNFQPCRVQPHKGTEKTLYFSNISHNYGRYHTLPQHFQSGELSCNAWVGAKQ